MLAYFSTQLKLVEAADVARGLLQDPDPRAVCVGHVAAPDCLTHLIWTQIVCTCLLRHPTLGVLSLSVYKASVTEGL